jgi:hypothetical protein
MRVDFVVFKVHILFICRITEGNFCCSAHLDKESSAIKLSVNDDGTKGEVRTYISTNNTFSNHVHYINNGSCSQWFPDIFVQYITNMFMKLFKGIWSGGQPAKSLYWPTSWSNLSVVESLRDTSGKVWI